MAKVRKSTIEDIAPRIEWKEDKKFGIIKYDIDNAYPQRVEDIFADSGTAMSCLRLFEKFVSGQGANDVDFGKTIINDEGMTVNSLIKRISNSKGKHSGVGIHVNYNSLGNIVSAHFVTFGYARLTTQNDKDHPDMVCIHPDWTARKGKKPKPEDCDYIHKFDPYAVLRQVEQVAVDTTGLSEEDIAVKRWENYKGQLWYWTPNGQDEYPLSPADACLEDMQTEAQTKRFKFGSSARNFLASHAIITGVEEQTFDDDGNPLESEEDGTLADVLTEFQGGDGAGGIMHLERTNPDEEIKIQKFDIQNYDGLYEYTEDSVTLDIIKQYNQPLILHITKEQNWGSGLELANAKRYYNEITEPDRNDIEEILFQIFSRWHTPINQSGDYTIKPLSVSAPITQEYFPYFTKAQIIESLGYDDPDEEVKDEQVLAVRLGSDVTNSLKALIADPALSIDQKKGSMIVLFGLTEEQADQMLGIDSNPLKKQAR